MHPFLRKSLLTLTLLLSLVGVATSLLVYGIQSVLIKDSREIAAKGFIHDLKSELFERMIFAVTQLQPLTWNSELIDALDRELPLTALQISREFIRSVAFHTDYIAIFDFDRDLLISSQQNLTALSYELSRFMKENSQNNSEIALFSAGNQIFQMIFLEIGSRDKPAGVLVFGFLWAAERAFAGLNSDFNNMQVSVIPLDRKKGQEIGVNERNPQAWKFKLDSVQLSIEVPLVNQDQPLRVNVLNFHSTKKLTILSLLLIPLAPLLTLGFLGYILISYLYQQTFQPLDRLYLFIKMLRDRNRFQKRPNFRSFPLFRRIADEILDHLKQIDSEKRSWQQKHHDLQKKIRCAQDLALLNPSETQIWAQMTIEILGQMLRVTECIKAKTGPWQTQDLEPVVHLNKTLHQYQVCFAMHGLTRSTSKLARLLHRLEPLHNLLDLATLENIENQIFEILEQLEQCDEIRVSWQGKVGSIDQQDGLNTIDKEWSIRCQKIADQLLQAKKPAALIAKVSKDLYSLLNEINSTPWARCEKRLTEYCIEYGQFVGKYPPVLSFEVGLNLLPQQQLLTIYPFLIETLGFLIDFSIEDRRTHTQQGKSEAGQLLVKIIADDDGFEVLCRADGQHLPIKEALAALIPSGGLQLDEIDEAECWDLFNKIQLEGFVRDFGVPPTHPRFLAHLMARCRNMGCEFVTNDHEVGGLQIAIKLQVKQLLMPADEIRSVETA